MSVGVSRAVERCAAVGVSYVHCAVSGGAAQAENGELPLWVGSGSHRAVVGPQQMSLKCPSLRLPSLRTSESYLGIMPLGVMPLACCWEDFLSGPIRLI